MNMRQLKRSHYARYNIVFPMFAGRSFIPERGIVLHVIDEEPTALGALLAKKMLKFVCSKVKDGSAADEFDTREEALALVIKHAKQKKAKLQVTQNGAPVLFTEEEMAF